MAQSWNSLLKYIKRKIGSPLNLVEYTDDDIYDIVYEDVLPAMSQYVGKPIWLMITSSDIAEVTSAENTNTYIIPIPTGVTLVKVIDAYVTSASTGILESYSSVVNVLDPRDTVMMNTYSDIIKSLGSSQSFTYMPPNKISFELPLGGDTIIECSAIHTDLSTIDGDIYYEIFREWCAAEVKENIAEMRSKYEGLTTPFGTINLNWQQMKQEAQEKKNTIQEKLDSLPPDRLISFID